MFSKANLLKAALFATGFSGIVAEYMLATMASYFLGDSVVQWTMILSVMLFAMGLGSRFSKLVTKRLLYYFILTEFALSILVGFSVMLAYSVSAYSQSVGFLIYAMAMGIGFLIGLEIPLVTRINQTYEDLRVNIASVMENDYYGSLIGGIFFAFIALPFIGLSYTPFILSSINLIVALILLSSLNSVRENINKKQLLLIAIPVVLLIATGAVFSEKIIEHGDQKKYLDKVIFSKQTPYQKITITQWKDNYWLYINGNQQLSTIDEFLYHEPMTHVAMATQPLSPLNVLVLGGGDGCAARELLKHKHIAKITLVDLDPEMTKIAKSNPIFTALNENSLHDTKVQVVNKDAFIYLEQSEDFYDLILIDLPDPKTVELGRLYSKEFYRLAYLHLKKTGSVITQAGSPYFAAKAFYCIEKSMQAAGFQAFPFHNQIITMGEWGWVLGTKNEADENIKQQIFDYPYNKLNTKWLNQEVVPAMFSFGKPLADTSGIEINTIQNPVLYRYYLKGNWDVY